MVNDQNIPLQDLDGDVDSSSTRPHGSPDASTELQRERTASVSKSLLDDNDDTDRLLPSHTGGAGRSHKKAVRQWVPPILQRQWNRISQHLPQGWRFGASLGVFLSSTVLVANIMVAAFSYTVIRDKGHDVVVAPIRTGDCGKIERVGSLIHLALNAASTLLLGASNYAMQVLSAPTRKDIDEAHRRGSWLDIGVLSIRNLAATRGTKLWLWLSLGISSVPLHLVYNSTFFVSTTNHHYDIYIANDQFATGARFDDFIGKYDDSSVYANYTPFPLPSGSNPYTVQNSLVDLTQGKESKFERLENDDCMSSYAKTILSDRRNLILVTSSLPTDNQQLHELQRPQGEIYRDERSISCENSSEGHILTSELGPVSCAANSSLYAIGHYAMPVIAMRPPLTSNWYSWMCSQYGYYFDWLDGTDGEHITPPDFVRSMPKEDYCSEGYWKKIQANETWSVYGFDIDYCLSEKLPDQCSLNVTVSLLMVVIAFNFVKVVVISMTLFTVKDKPLITIGDAVSSFIQERDITTRGICLLTKEDLIQSTRTQTKESRRPFSLFKKRPASRGSFQLLSPKSFQTSNPRGFHAASLTRWLTSSILTLTAILALLGLLAYAVITLQRDASLGSIPSIWSLGLHTTSPHTLITHWSLPLTGPHAIIPAVLISNTPQALLSLLALALNGLVTAMSVAREHAAHATRPRALRVAAAPPVGAQRGSYFLQVPYRLGVPATLLSVLVHWSLSQALFVVKVDGADARGVPRRGWTFSITTCGYSPLALVLAVVGVAVGWGAVVALGARRVRAEGMPVAGCCSAVVAAACQGPRGTGEGAGLMWGVVEGRDGVGRCALQDRVVGRPVAGRFYA